MKNLRLADLQKKLLGITPAIGEYLAEACAVCFVSCGYDNHVELKIEGTINTSYCVIWENQVSENQHLSWKDMRETVEYGATAIALLLVLELTEYTVLSRARQGEGFDYWLGEIDETGKHTIVKAGLEISGIFKTKYPSIINARVKQKKEQTIEIEIPVYIIVVVFNKALVKFIEQ